MHSAHLGLGLRALVVFLKLTTQVGTESALAVCSVLVAEAESWLGRKNGPREVPARETVSFLGWRLRVSGSL